ncbi:MAG: hypothetical protein JWO82_2186 [Akkermansiaceae bacterium]|nr:hypothetical protein [Akkermansiaceae bacterium]
MAGPKRHTIYLTDDEAAILDAISARQKLSRSAVMRHLLIYQGLCGGDMPLTRKILGLPETDRDRVLGEIRRRTESNDPATPQKFKAWVLETLGSADPAALETGADLLLKKLLGG